MLVIQQRKHTLHSFAENVACGNEAYHEVSIAREIVEMPWVNQDSDLPQQINREIFVSLQCGNPQYRVPTAINMQALACFLAAELIVQFLQVVSNAIEQQRLKTLSLIE